MSKKLLIIEGDWNDADYVTSINEVTDKDLVKLIPILKKMKKGKDDYTENWSEKYDGVLTDKEIEMLEEYVPSGYESSCHSIESITVYEINSKKVYL